MRPPPRSAWPPAQTQPTPTSTPALAPTPTPRPVQNMSSPPLPPQLHDDAVSVSDDESLGESFINIGSGDEEDSRSSALGSLDESLLETLTVSSRDSATSSSERRANIALLEGSYVDGEATDTDAHSITTLHDSLSSSHVRLIMPNPEASFLSASASTSISASGTLSDAATPSASLANLGALDEAGRLAPQCVALPRRKRGVSPGRGVPRSWLEESSKLWNVSPDVASNTHDAAEYTLLASQEAPVPSGARTLAEKADIIPKAQEQLPKPRVRASVGDALALVRNSANKRNVAFSVLLLAGIVLGLHSFPSSPISPVKRLVSSTESVSQATTSAADRSTTPIWDHVPLSPLPPTPLSAETTSVLARASTTCIPDMKLVKHAISTFSTRSLKQSPATPDKDKSHIVIKDSVTAPDGRASASSCKACRSLSVRPSNVALSAGVSSTLASRGDIWTRVIRETVMRANASSDPFAPTANATEPCACSMMRHVKLEVLNRINHFAVPAKNYALVVGDYLDHIYGPLVAELHRELGELAALAHSLAETSSTVTQFIIHRAARGLSVSRHGLDAIASRIQQYIPSPLELPLAGETEAEVKQAAREAIVLAKASYDHLSEYMEEQAVSMQENLRQAKRGLDVLVDQAKAIIGDSTTGKTQEIKEEAKEDEKENEKEDRVARTNVKLDGPMPFSLMDRRFKRADAVPHSRPGRVHRAFRRLERKAERWQRERGRMRGVMERPTTARRIWDAVHHGAVAFVLR